MLSRGSWSTLLRLCGDGATRTDGLYVVEDKINERNWDGLPRTIFGIILSMNPVLSGPVEDNPSDNLNPEYLVAVIVPEEFAGTSQGQIHSHGGVIKEMEVRAGTVAIHAVIVEHQFAELARAITEATRGSGKVERSLNLDE
jgi:translation elongation factor EF-G